MMMEELLKSIEAGYVAGIGASRKASMKAKYEIGDTAWLARYERVAHYVKCDVCAGKKYLEVTMGDGSIVTIDCAHCQSGYEQPTGTTTEWGCEPSSMETVITGVEMEDGGVFRYRTRDSYSTDECDLFSNEDEANSRAHSKFLESKAEEKRRLEHVKQNEKRTWAWNAGYHRREIKRCERELEYHRAKLDAANRHKKVAKVEMIEK